MSAILSDKDIEILINEKKSLPADYRTKIQVRPKRGHKERELEVSGFEVSFDPQRKLFEEI